MPNLTVSEKLSDIIRTIQDAGYEAYIVGGAVRDTFLGIVPHDYDIATNATAEFILSIGGKYISPNADIDVFTIDGYEIARYRSETNYDGCRPGSIIYDGCTIETDLARRDFTMNAMYARLNTENKMLIYDVYSGKSDINKKILRTVGNPEHRFNEDRLRILRAFRFASTYNMQFSKEIDDVLIDERFANALYSLPKERIMQEIRKTICSGKKVTLQFIDMVHRYGYFERVFRIDGIDRQYPIIRKLLEKFHGLSEEIIYSIILYVKYNKLPSEQTRYNIIKNDSKNVSLTSGEIKRVLFNVTHLNDLPKFDNHWPIENAYELYEYFQNMYSIYFYDVAKVVSEYNESNAFEDAYDIYFNQKQNLNHFDVTGHDLDFIEDKKLLGKILDSLKFAVFNGSITCKREQIISYAKSLYSVNIRLIQNNG